MKKHQLVFIIFLSLVPAFILAQGTVEIKVGLNGGLTYTPKDALCTVGDTIKFTWLAGNHPTRSDDGIAIPSFSMNSTNITKSIIFSSPGIIPYYCVAHGNANGVGMAGTITVNANPAGLISKTLQNSLSVFPNPASEKLSVNFVVKKESFVSIKLIDVLGNEVTTLINERYAIGEFKPSLAIPSKLSKGLYFVKVSVGTEIAIKRISIQ